MFWAISINFWGINVQYGLNVIEYTLKASVTVWGVDLYMSLF